MDHIIITNTGQELLTRLSAGEATAEFVRFVTSSAEYSEEELEGLEVLKDSVQESVVTNAEIRNENTIVISGAIDNKDLQSGYYITLIGLFAKAAGEEEILYAVTKVSSPVYMPEMTGTLSGMSIRFTLKVGNSQNVTIQVDDTHAVTIGEFNAFKGEVETIIEEDLNSLMKPEFEDYEESGTVIPDLEVAMGEIVSGKTIPALLQYIKASLKGLYTLAQKAYNVALGRNQARVFATVAELDAWLAVEDNVAQLHVGDNFYIVAVNVPDYWWDGAAKQPLETQKVDMTTYDQEIANLKAEDSKLNGNISTLSERIQSFESTKSSIVSSGLGKALALTATSTWAQLVAAITGVTDQGAKTSSLNCGGSYTIPKGYHNGSGKVTANSLASQTDANAAAAQILSGFTAWIKGSKVTGTMPNKGALNWSGSNTTHAVSAGYYSGGTLDSRPSYNAGVTAADNRVNTNSTNYKSGYNAGSSDKFNSLYNNCALRGTFGFNYQHGTTQKCSITIPANAIAFIWIYNEYYYDGNTPVSYTTSGNPSIKQFDARDLSASMGKGYKIKGYICKTGSAAATITFSTHGGIWGGYCY
ncbi:MAG: phage tail protein [Clostridiales bacterium]|nr:phage tail protein [Clostridiales bacterium]